MAGNAFAALIVQHLYHNRYLTTLNFIEEALPFTDVIPTASIGESKTSRPSQVDLLGPLLTCSASVRFVVLHSTPAHAGWFMEYTQGGKKIQSEGKPAARPWLPTGCYLPRVRTAVHMLL